MIIYKIAPLLIVALTLSACNAKPFNKVGDKSVRFLAHKSIAPITPSWQRPAFKQYSYFGQYRNSADKFHPYYGDPLGAVVGIWQEAHYLGKKPDIKDCIKPKAPYEIGGKYGLNSPEFKKSENEYSMKLDEYQSCAKRSYTLKQKSKTITHYYARSPQSHQIVIPKRTENHGIYEIHLFFGPLGGIKEDRLPRALQAEKNTLIRSSQCGRGFYVNGNTTCYHLPGNKSSLYYKVISLLKNPPVKKGLSSSAWQHPKSIYEQIAPKSWQEVKGIKITPKQYDYLNERCISHRFSCFLDKDAPDLTAEQKAYIKATAWDIDTDKKARDAFIKKTKHYQANKD